MEETFEAGRVAALGSGWPWLTHLSYERPAAWWPEGGEGHGGRERNLKAAQEVSGSEALDLGGWLAGPALWGSQGMAREWGGPSGQAPWEDKGREWGKAVGRKGLRTE